MEQTIMNLIHFNNITIGKVFGTKTGVRSLHSTHSVREIQNYTYMY